MRITKAQAEKFLSKVEGEKCFFCNDGQVFCSLEELVEGLKKMEESVFSYHSNREKNDFARWIEDVFGDKDLAKDLVALSLNRKASLKKITNRIKVLKRIKA